MIWVGSFKSLQSMRPDFRFENTPLEVHTWVRSEIGLISAGGLANEPDRWIPVCFRRGGVR